MKRSYIYSATLCTTLSLAITCTLSYTQRCANCCYTPCYTYNPCCFYNPCTGLRREILIPAPTGAQQPQVGQTVTVHYTGWLQECCQLGRMFDSSVQRGQPFSFVIGTGQVIKGWDEGILAMKVGEKSRFTIPPELAYGIKGVDNIIPPCATLIFDIELLSIS